MEIYIPLYLVPLLVVGILWLMKWLGIYDEEDLIYYAVLTLTYFTFVFYFVLAIAYLYDGGIQIKFI